MSRSVSLPMGFCYPGAAVLPLPHPSPRNNIWLKANPWFAAEILPHLQARVRAIVGSA